MQNLVEIGSHSMAPAPHKADGFVHVFEIADDLFILDDHRFADMTFYDIALVILVIFKIFPHN
ncbi:MAG: hypothetical protein LBL20_06175 [Treponema sp.]|nr:hypothetical protein [Treponema sp.]